MRDKREGWSVPGLPEGGDALSDAAPMGFFTTHPKNLERSSCIAAKGGTFPLFVQISFCRRARGVTPRLVR